MCRGFKGNLTERARSGNFSNSGSLPLVSVIHYEMSQSQGSEADTCQPTHTFKDAIFTPGEETEEDRRQRHLAELTADSDVKAPGMWQRFKEEIAQNIYEKIWRIKKDEQTSSA